MRAKRHPKVEFLGGLPLFADCSREDLHEIAAIADEITLRRGKRLITEGEPGDEFLVLISGEASVYKAGIHVATVGPSDFVGEMALLSGRPRSATIVATSPVRALVIARPRFLSLADRIPGMRERLDDVIPLREAP